MEKVICNECKKEFEIKVRVKKHKQGIEETYFKCPHCKTKYTSIYTNEEIRKLQSDVRRLLNKYCLVGTEEERSKIKVQLSNVKYKLKLKMNELKKEMKNKE
ncbi:hypothetical protein CLPU_36c00070 [Gottschalkia purinilytica]|uniref:Transglycosylase n=1 Tax=Gottschalkia purinilytica TaxID=1503 RepID=A0A0L0W681_GOTPU|nr:hypothetical protein [Gottschalkia purinilytica]KNF06991.1 hypothetical protein CLPU_36c00070 [Gottschalkia purinilytica]